MYMLQLIVSFNFSMSLICVDIVAIVVFNVFVRLWYCFVSCVLHVLYNL